MNQRTLIVIITLAIKLAGWIIQTINQRRKRYDNQGTSETKRQGRKLAGIADR
jgi:dethiobiotin synthetase